VTVLGKNAPAYKDVPDTKPASSGAASAPAPTTPPPAK